MSYVKEDAPLMEKLRGRVRKAAFEALYSRFAWAYDRVSKTFFAGQWRVWQRAAIPHLRGPDVLEVGMGTGNLQIDLHRKGFHVTGSDLSPQMLRQAVRKARRLDVTLQACRARAQALPFAAESFDSVVSTFPSEYIGGAATLGEIARVLRPGGRLVIVPGGWLAPVDAKGKTLERFARLVYGPGSGGGLKPVWDPLDQANKEHWASTWVRLLRGRMEAAGIGVTVYVASNKRGAALVLVGEKRAA